MVRIRIDICLLIKSAPPGNVRFDTDNGFDTRRLGFQVKLKRSVHRSVIGDRKRTHTEGLRPFDKMIKLPKPIKQGEFAMCMQVNKIGHS